MASIQRDLALGIVICAIGYCTARLVHEQLIAVSDVTKITQEPKKPEIQPDEDAIKLETLEKLVSNANRDIGQAAIKIIAERAVRGRTYEFLLRHIMGKNEEKRDKALTTLCFLHERVDDQVLKPTFAIFKAVIKCLCTSKMNREAEHFEKVIKTGACFYRSQHYNDALRLLRRIVLDSENGLREALRAGLVTDWLMHYPWQVAAADDSPKEAIKARMQWPHPDATMSWILRELAKNKKRFPSDQIEDFGLFDQPSFDSGAATTTMNPSVFLEDMSLEEEWMAMNEGSRTHEESEEEAMLRRRRREAVIIQEDGQPPGSADIIQRLTTDLPGSPADSAQELELLQQRRDEINLAALQRITQSTG